MYGKKKSVFLCFYDPLLSFLDSITLDFSIDMEIQ